MKEALKSDLSVHKSIYTRDNSLTRVSESKITRLKHNCLWNAVRTFITFFTKYKTYLSYIIILPFYIIILFCNEIRPSIEEKRLSFKGIRRSV